MTPASPSPQRQPAPAAVATACAAGGGAPACGQRLTALSGLGALLVLAGLLAGCGSAPPRGGAEPSAPRPPRAVPATPAAPAGGGVERDGPEANPPPDLLLVPDATPRLEPVRSGGPNKPYEVLGQAYTPLQGDPPLLERGLASWYGRKFHGKGTSTGEAYNMYAMTAAHRTMPLPSYARVRNLANGREVIVRVNDRGPFHSTRVIDLSYTAALKLGLLGGVAMVELERITYDAIRSGSWREPADGRAVAMLPEPAAQPVADPIAELARRLSSQPRAARPLARGAPSPVPAAVAAAAAALPVDAQAAAAVPDVAAVDAPVLARPVLASMPALDAPPVAAAGKARAQAAATPGHRGFWLQLGAFKLQAGAVDFQQRVVQEAGWLAPLLAIFNEQSLHRLQAGPYASRSDAQGAAERLRAALQLVPTIVERR